MRGLCHRLLLAGSTGPVGILGTTAVPEKLSLFSPRRAGEHGVEFAGIRSVPEGLSLPRLAERRGGELGRQGPTDSLSSLRAVLASTAWISQGSGRSPTDSPQRPAGRRGVQLGDLEIPTGLSLFSPRRAGKYGVDLFCRVGQRLPSSSHLFGSHSRFLALLPRRMRRRGS